MTNAYLCIRTKTFSVWSSWTSEACSLCPGRRRGSWCRLPQGPLLETRAKVLFMNDALTISLTAFGITTLSITTKRLCAKCCGSQVVHYKASCNKYSSHFLSVTLCLFGLYLYSVSLSLLCPYYLSLSLCYLSLDSWDCLIDSHSL